MQLLLVSIVASAPSSISSISTLSSIPEVTTIVITIVVVEISLLEVSTPSSLLIIPVSLFHVQHVLLLSMIHDLIVSKAPNDHKYKHTRSGNRRNFMWFPLM